MKVLDFGLAKNNADPPPSLTGQNAVLGTPLYISPEALKSAALVDARSDIYSLGAVAYCMLTGEPVFTGSSTVEVCAKHLHSAPIVPSERLGRHSSLGSFWRCWTLALVLSGCSQPPIHPDPHSSECARMDAQANARERQRAAEVVLLRSELQKHPDDAERWAKLGKAHLYADTAAAIAAFERATHLAPNVASHWKGLGEAHWSNTADDPSAAKSSEAALLSCLQRDPRRGDCHCSLGLVRRFQGNHTEALQSFTRAAEHGACEYWLARELLELGELEQSNVLIRAQIARTPSAPDNFDKLYVLHELELQIALRRGDLTRARAARQRLAEYTLKLSAESAFNLGSTYAVSRPPQPTVAKQLLNHFVQSSCDDSPNANDCDQCVVARDLLVKLAASNP